MESSEQNKLLRFIKLDSLRGIFSLMVVIYHFQSRIPEKFHSFFISTSYTFVDFFFILSGFVIAYNYSNINDFQDLKVYLLKRFIRLYPLLLFTLILFSIGFVFSKSVLFFKINFFETLLLSNSSYVLGNNPGFNTPTWSISAEFYSYFLFGLLLVLLNKSIRLLAFVLIVFLAFSYMYNLGYYFSTISYGFLRGFVGFFLGVLILYLYKIDFKINNIFELFIVFGIFIVFYFVNKDIDKLLKMCLIPIFFSLSILILLKTNGLLSKVLELNFFQYLGKISYSIYLMHTFLLHILDVLLSKFNIDLSNYFRVSLVLSILLFSTIIISNITYNLIEVKISRYLKNLIFSKSIS